MAANGDSFTGQHVGLLTRVDPVEPLAHAADRTWPYPLANGYASACALASRLVGTQGLTKHLVARLRPDGMDRPLTVVGLHLLAVPDSTDRCAKREAQVGACGGAARVLRLGSESSGP